MRDHDPGRDLEGEVGGDQGVIVEPGAVHDVGQPHQGRVPHVQRGVVQGVAEAVQRASSVASDPGKISRLNILLDFNRKVFITCTGL